MPFLTIAGLTLKEAVRRRTLVGAFLLGVLVLGLSLLLRVIRMRFDVNLATKEWTPDRFMTQYGVARSLITSLCLFTIRALGSLFAILVAGGAISGEVERGLLAVILPRPLSRWQILFGKWLGLNGILVGSVLLWTAMVWGSLTLQVRAITPQADLTSLLRAGFYLSLFPVVIGTLTLSLSTFTSRLLGTSLALGLSLFAWLDGIFNALGDAFDVRFLHLLADAAGLVVPQGYIAWWVEGTAQDLLAQVPRGPQIGSSSQFLKEWGQAHLHVGHLDAVYVVLYVVMVLALGAVVFQRRDL